MMIRHARITDLDELTRIEAVSYPKAEGASKDSIQKRIEKFPNHFWILEEMGEIKAFVNGMVTDEENLTDEMYEHARMHTEEGNWQMIFSVVTDPKYRKCGLARKVMQAVIEDTKQEKRLGIVLTCKKELISFYEQFGFQNEGISMSNHGDVTWYQMRLRF